MAVSVDYFSDVFCIWAYGGHVRVDELRRQFGPEVKINYRFVPIFAAGRHNVALNWKDKGGMAGFRDHLLEVASLWQHVEVCRELWVDVAPESSTAAHLYLKAAQILTERGEIPAEYHARYEGRNLFEQLVWRFRCAFFQEGRNVSLREVQDEIARSLGLPVDRIDQMLDSGEPHAALHLDDEAKLKYKVPGSPTLVLNEGRQLLYGNIGYRVVDANVRELMHNPLHGEASWC